MREKPEPLARTSGGRRRRWIWTLSVLLHALTLAIAFYFYRVMPPPVEEAHQNVASNDVAVVFESANKTPPSQKSEDTTHQSMQDSGDNAQDKTPPSQAARAAPQATPVPPATPTAEPAPAQEATVTPFSDQPEVPVTPLRAPDMSVPRVAPLPAPAPAPPAAPSPARLARRTPPQTFGRVAPNGFPVPMAFSFGGNQNAVSSRGNAGALASARPLGGSSPRSAGGADFLADFSLVSGADPGKDWFGELLKWWIEHRRYPDQAARNNEQGDPGLRITVEKSGRVREVQLVTRSGSIWLDMGSQATFRDQHLPPFPPQTNGDVSVIAINIHYYLIYR